jgi:hypothetical protein
MADVDTPDNHATSAKGIHYFREWHHEMKSWRLNVCPSEGIRGTLLSFLIFAAKGNNHRIRNFP